jgi:protocatechuate 3,4-dioxygenase beta subunit
LPEDSVKTASFAFLALASVLSAQAPTVAPSAAPWRVGVAPAGEPGRSLVIGGIVHAEDGRTPLRGASVYVYQTDSRGYYAADDPRASDNPRLRGYMRTDAQGRYEFSTVRPGSYPGTRNPGHIHYHVSAPGYRERVFEIVFEGDPFIPEQWRRDAGNPDAMVAIVRLAPLGEQGFRGEQNVTLRRQ